MDPRDFHQLAIRLAQGTSPAELRTAVSRTYYAVYHCSVEMLEGMEFRISTGPAAHGEVQHYLSNCGDPEIIRVGSELTDLHSKRIEADYRLLRRRLEHPQTVQALVEQGRRMLEQLEACHAGERRRQIMEAIQAWRRRIAP